MHYYLEVLGIHKQNYVNEQNHSRSKICLLVTHLKIFPGFILKEKKPIKESEWLFFKKAYPSFCGLSLSESNIFVVWLDYK